MTNSGKTLLFKLGEAYVKDGYEDRAGWYVTSDDESAGDFQELSAHGLVEPFNGGWRLTPAGLRMVMDVNLITKEAKATLREIREAYIQAGSPAPEGWYVDRDSDARLPALRELQSRGFLRQSGTGYQRWFLTNEGLRAILKDGTT